MRFRCAAETQRQFAPPLNVTGVGVLSACVERALEAFVCFIYSGAPVFNAPSCPVKPYAAVCWLIAPVPLSTFFDALIY